MEASVSCVTAVSAGNAPPSSGSLSAGAAFAGNASSAFNSTPLHMILQNMGKRTLVLTGLITNGCVESTARDARDLGYRVVLVGDACATYSDQTHRRTLRWLERTIGNVAATDAVVATLLAHAP